MNLETLKKRLEVLEEQGTRRIETWKDLMDYASEPGEPPVEFSPAMQEWLEMVS